MSADDADWRAEIFDVGTAFGVGATFGLMAEGWPVVQQRRSALFVLSSANRIGNAIGHNSFAASDALHANSRLIIRFVCAPQFIRLGYVRR